MPIPRLALSASCYVFLFASLLSFSARPASAQTPNASTTPASAQTPASLPSAAPVPQVRITQAIDETNLTALHGNVHPLARPEYDQGAAPPQLPLERMLLVLKRNPEQEAALQLLLEQQQDKSSPYYHKWLTPEQLGQQFGPADQDIQTVTSWLESHGFRISRVAKGRAVIEFSGVATQLQKAFHTEFHRYKVNGEDHWASSSDPQIPTALTPVIAGIFTLHNFYKRPQVKISDEKITAEAKPGTRPQFTSATGLHALAPADYYKIYNFDPRQPGTSAKIAIVGRSNINPQDILYFHYWLMGNQAATPQVILNGPDPGDLGGAEETEAVLDTTWAGAVAPTAWLALVVSKSTATTDGIDLSAAYIIDNNLADVMSESFGDCEAHFTSAQATGVANLAQQAAAQGITYVVAAGDSGSAGCDDPHTETLAVHPPSVNMLASTPYTVAVGGTIFNENGRDNTYWGTSNAPNTFESALSYIPENVWNESCTSNQSGCTKPNIFAGGGGVSTFFTKPSWQSGVAGIPADNARDLPDVSLTAAGHDPYLLCIRGSCVPNAQGQISFAGVSGTSAAAPAFAGIMALVGQKNLVRLGQPNYVLYRLAAAENLSACNASNTTSLPGTACVFNDVSVGNNAVPGEAAYGTSNAQYQSGKGYDLATGLGSINVTNLINQWNTVTFSPTTTTFSISPIAATHGAPLNVTVNVKPNTGTGIPSGTVWLLQNGFSNGNFVGNNTADTFTLDATGSFAGVSHLLPGGTYQVNAHYAGDGTYAASDSTPPIQVSIQPESTSTAFSVLTTDASGNLVPFSGGPYGTPVIFQTQVTWPSGYGWPSSYVTFWDNGSLIAQAQLDHSGHGLSLPNNQITSGSHSITAGYYGDNSFSASTNSTPITFNITRVQTATALTPQQSPQTLTLTATVSASGLGSAPIGLVTFTNGGTVLGTANLTSGTTSAGTTQAVATFDGTQLPAGQYNITASYAGDSNYIASNSSVISLNLKADFNISNRGITSLTTAAGQTASYINDIAITPFFGFSSPVTLSCTLPAQATTCSVNPASVTTASGANIASIAVTTTTRTAEVFWQTPKPFPFLPLTRPVTIVGILCALLLILGRTRKQRSAAILVLACLIVIAGIGPTACGGGAGGSSPPPPPAPQTGTPAGTYTVTVTGTANSVTHTMTLSLVVQ